MKQDKIAAQILKLLDERKRKMTILKLAILLLGSFAALVWANRWDSPLAVIPRTMFGVLLGYLLLYLQSVRLYPRIERYFNIEELKRDAQQSPPPYSSPEAGSESGEA